MIGFIYYSEEHSSNLKILLSPLRHCTTGMLLLILLHGQKVVHYPYPAAFQMISSKIVIAETKKYWDGVQHGHLTTQEEASLALVSNRSGDGVTIKISFRVDVLLDWPPCPPPSFYSFRGFFFFLSFFFSEKFVIVIIIAIIFIYVFVEYYPLGGAMIFCQKVGKKMS